MSGRENGCRRRRQAECLFVRSVSPGRASACAGFRAVSVAAPIRSRHVRSLRGPVPACLGLARETRIGSSLCVGQYHCRPQSRGVCTIAAGLTVAYPRLEAIHVGSPIRAARPLVHHPDRPTRYPRCRFIGNLGHPAARRRVTKAGRPRFSMLATGWSRFAVGGPRPHRGTVTMTSCASPRAAPSGLAVRLRGTRRRHHRGEPDAPPPPTSDDPVYQPDGRSAVGDTRLPTILSPPRTLHGGPSGPLDVRSVIAQHPPALPVRRDRSSLHSVRDRGAGYRRHRVHPPVILDFTIFRNWNDVGVSCSTSLSRNLSGDLAPTTTRPVAQRRQQYDFELWLRPSAHPSPGRRAAAGPTLCSAYTTSPGQKLTPQISAQRHPNDTRVGAERFCDFFGDRLPNGYSCGYQTDHRHCATPCSARGLLASRLGCVPH